MTTLHFPIRINAPKEKVWQTLWDDTTYRQWTSPFMEGSYAESDWQEGSKVLFMGPDGSGMFAIIEKKKDHEQMTFKHLGEIKNGVEETRDWGDAIESYHLQESNGATQLNVELSATPEMEKYFNDIFPKALGIVKQIAEQ